LKTVSLDFAVIASRKGGQFSVELKPFMEILNETDQFFGWVVKEMLPLRKAQGKSLGKPNGKSSA
jgi:hypothetical protein